MCAVARGSGSEGALKFVPNMGMAENLFHLVDVGHADATVKTDIPLILDELLPQTLGVEGREAAVAKRNSLAKSKQKQKQKNRKSLNMMRTCLLKKKPSRSDTVIFAVIRKSRRKTSRKSWLTSKRS